MDIACHREPSHDAAVLLRDEDGSVVVATDGLEVTALVGGASPLSGGDEPALAFRADLAGEVDEAVGVAGLSPPNAKGHRTTTPAPPRRGSPAASSVPSSRSPTADAPPKYRFRLRQRTTS